VVPQSDSGPHLHPPRNLIRLNLSETLWSSLPGVAMTLDGQAQKETLVFLSFFADLPDSRQPAKVIYPLPEVLALCRLAVLSGAANFVNIAR
jgi:hypothetical protein